MKRILLLIFFPALTGAQEPADGIFPLKDGKIYYEKVVIADSISKDQLYKITKSWGVSSFRSQKDVLQADDKETGLIAYKGFFSVPIQYPPLLGVKNSDAWKYWFVMKVLIKDGRAKAIVEDVDLTDASQGGKNSSILNYRNQTEQYWKKGMAGKGYRDKLYIEVKKNFIAANQRIISFIESWEDAVTIGKSEFDF